MNESWSLPPPRLASVGSGFNPLGSNQSLVEATGAALSAATLLSNVSQDHFMADNKVSDHHTASTLNEKQVGGVQNSTEKHALSQRLMPANGSQVAMHLAGLTGREPESREAVPPDEPGRMLDEDIFNRTGLNHNAKGGTVGMVGGVTAGNDGKHHWASQLYQSYSPKQHSADNNKVSSCFSFKPCRAAVCFAL